MTRARGRVVLLCVAALIIASALLVAALSSRRSQPSTADARGKPQLLLLTSLPIIFNEDFGLQGGGSPVLKALSKTYRLLPISVTSAEELSKGDLLLIAHAPAQTAENLVALDDWVRRGGRVLLLADPLLEWPSKRPLGDPLRPAPMFMDTGLLAHWGLRLDAPDERGVSARKLGSYQVVTASPGRLTGSCAIEDQGLAALCRIGRGEAIVIADADFLDTPAFGGGAEHNLDSLLEQLDRLGRTRFAKSQTYPQGH